MLIGEIGGRPPDLFIFWRVVLSFSSIFQFNSHPTTWYNLLESMWNLVDILSDCKTYFFVPTECVLKVRPCHDGDWRRSSPGGSSGRVSSRSRGPSHVEDEVK